MNYYVFAILMCLYFRIVISSTFVSDVCVFIIILSLLRPLPEIMFDCVLPTV